MIVEKLFPKKRNEPDEKEIPNQQLRASQSFTAFSHSDSMRRRICAGSREARISLFLKFYEGRFENFRQRFIALEPAVVRGLKSDLHLPHQEFVKNKEREYFKSLRQSSL